MIIASAVKFTKDEKEFVIIGKRHHNCFEIAYNAGLRRPWTEVQGFVDDTFNFLDRRAAYRNAVNCGQIEEGEYPGTLFSEDIFPPKPEDGDD